MDSVSMRVPGVRSTGAPPAGSADRNRKAVASEIFVTASRRPVLGSLRSSTRMSLA